MRSHRRTELGYEVTGREWVCRRWGVTEEQSWAMRSPEGGGSAEDGESQKNRDGL